MPEWIDKLGESFKGKPVQLLINAAAVLVSAAVILTIVVVAVIAICKYGLPFALFIAILWVPFACGTVMHGSVFFSWPGTFISNVATGLVLVIGAAAGIAGLVIYWTFFTTCWSKPGDLSSVREAVCLQAPWLVTFCFVISWFVIAVSSFEAAICVFNLISGNLAKKAGRRMLDNLSVEST